MRRKMLESVVKDMIAKIWTEKLSEETSPVTINGWMQLRSLFVHIQGVISRLPVDEHTQYVVGVCYLVDCFLRFAYHYMIIFNEYLEKTDIELDSNKHIYKQHRAIEKLCLDWETLSLLCDAARYPHIQVLDALVHSALPNKIGKYEMTIPYLGRQFDLVGLTYAPKVFVTGIPLYNLETPWDWQVIWHEMAGHVVRQFGVHKDLVGSFGDIWQEWSQKYKIGWDDEPEDESEDEPEKDPETSGKPISTQNDSATDRIRPRMTKVGWMAEIKEDIYGVVSLGSAMLKTLRRVLHQHYDGDKQLKDNRHPPPEVRFEVSEALWQDIQSTVETESISKGKMRPVSSIVRFARALRDELEATKCVDVFTVEQDQQAHKISNLLTEQASIDRAREVIDSIEMTRKAKLAVLVAAARLAFDAAPAQALHIAKTVPEIVKLIASPSKAQEKEIAPPTQKQLEKLIKAGTGRGTRVKRLDLLLDKQYRQVDRVRPRTHSHPHGTVVLTFKSFDGVYHSIPHSHP